MQHEIKSNAINISKPFYGLLLHYYYYDRTLRNEEILKIPANRNIDLNELIDKRKR